MIIARNVLVFVCLVLIAIFALRQKQDEKLNWSIFFAGIYTITSLPIVNYVCVQQGWWTFLDQPTNSIQFPFDIYFIWACIWGFVPVLFIKQKYFLLIPILFFWLDILLMPVLEEFGILVLSDQWLWGELLLLCTVLLPAMLWAYLFYFDKLRGIRACFQVLVMGLIFIIGLPFILHSYGLIKEFNLAWSFLEIQFLLILIFPALVATFDLVKIGKGTPFPYDPTSNLVETGIYAYIRNPIQWSFTLMFVSLSIYHSSFYLLLGSVVSIAYAFGVSDFQEYPDMEKRFSQQWKSYKDSVPKWYFLWRPKNYPIGKIYFDENCHPCSQLQSWFMKSHSTNLQVESSNKFPGEGILQLTYIDHRNTHFKSIEALSKALEHIHLGWACLAWFIRVPGIKHILQAIVNSMDFDSVKKCETGKTEDL